MTHGGKRANQTGRPKKPYKTKRMSVPEPLVDDVEWLMGIFKKHGSIEIDLKVVGIDMLHNLKQE